MHTPSTRSTTRGARTSSTGSSAPGTGEYLSRVTGQGGRAGPSGLPFVPVSKRPLEPPWAVRCLYALGAQSSP